MDEVGRRETCFEEMRWGWGGGEIKWFLVGHNTEKWPFVGVSLFVFLGPGAGAGKQISQIQAVAPRVLQFPSSEWQIPRK